jgi:hypothetical protein
MRRVFFIGIIRMPSSFSGEEIRNGYSSNLGRLPGVHLATRDGAASISLPSTAKNSSLGGLIRCI